MNEQGIFCAYFQSHLSDSFKKRLTFNVSGCSSNLRDNHIRLACPTYIVDKRFDFVRNMGDYLHRLAQILTSAFLVQHIPVHFAGCQVGKPVQILVDETLIMSEVEVGFRAVLCDKNLSMLIRAHRPRVYINIRIQFLRGDLQTPLLQESAQ